jgi:hypothetical protein
MIVTNQQVELCGTDVVVPVRLRCTLREGNAAHPPGLKPSSRHRGYWVNRGDDCFATGSKD